MKLVGYLAFALTLVLAGHISAAEVASEANGFEVTRRQFNALPDFEVQEQVDLANGSWTCKMFDPFGKVAEVYNLQTITMDHMAHAPNMNLNSVDDAGTANVVAILNINQELLFGRSINMKMDMTRKSLWSHVARFSVSVANRGQLKSTEGKQLITRNSEKIGYTFFDSRDFFEKRSRRANANFVRLDESQHQLVIETDVLDFFSKGVLRSVINGHFSALAYSLCEMPML